MPGERTKCVPALPWLPALLQALIERGEAWKVQMENAVASRSSLKKVCCLHAALHQLKRPLVPPCSSQPMHVVVYHCPFIPTSCYSPALQLRDVLAAGMRLPVDLPEKETLQEEIRRREWEEAARRSLQARPNVNSLAGLSELLVSAAELGTEHSPMMEALRWEGGKWEGLGQC